MGTNRNEQAPEIIGKQSRICASPETSYKLLRFTLSFLRALKTLNFVNFSEISLKAPNF